MLLVYNMLSRKTLTRFPRLAPRVLGMSLDQFDSLYIKFEPLYLQLRSKSELTVRDRRKRHRRVGGGRHHTLNLRDRLLLYLFWRHARPTQIILSQLYGLSRGSIVAILSDIHQVLVQLYSFDLNGIPNGPRTIRTLDQFFDAFPEIRTISNHAKSGGIMSP